MKKIKASVIATVVLVALCVVFAGAIAFTLLNKKDPSAAAGTAGPGQTMPGPAGTAGQGQPPGAPGGNAPGTVPRTANRNATIVRVAPVVLGDIRRSVVINGDVLAGNQVSLNPNVAGKLAETYIKIGDTVRAGQTVATVDPSRPGEVYSKNPVVSTISGTVLSAPVNTGDSVTAQTAIFVIGDLTTLVVETYVPERFSTVLRRGLPADVVFEAMPGESFKAEVYEVSPVLDPASRTTRIKLRFTARDPRIKVGMFAAVHLVTQQVQDVPVIPRAALINTAGQWICYVVNQQDIAERRVLSLGLESEEMVEIIEGVNPGERVVTAGQNFLSDNEPVRIVE